jgi:hypothetical protein
MANTKISQLPVATTPLTGSELVPIVQDGVTKNVTAQNLNGGGSGGGAVTQVLTGTGLTGGPITTFGTISIADTAVTPGTYTNPSVTVNAQGQVTAASSGSTPVTSVSGTANQITSSGGTTPTLSLPDSLTFTGKTVTGGIYTGATVENTPIGGTTPAAGTFTTMNATSGNITDAPTTTNSIVNKAYADAVATGLTFHANCNLATTTALPTCTYNNGTSGVGATLTATANGLLTVDSVSAVLGYRILVKDQASQVQNGIYTVTQVGSGSLPFELTRATDYNTPGTTYLNVDAGDFTLILAGTVNAGTSWVQTVLQPITIGSTGLNFVQFGSGTVLYSASTGLTLSGTNQFSITDTGVSSATYGTASAVPKIGVNKQGQITSASDTNIAISGSQVTSGSVAIAQGGTGQTAQAAGFNALSPITTLGDLIVGTGTNTAARLGIGSKDQVLTVSGGTAVWAPATTATTPGGNPTQFQYNKGGILGGLPNLTTDGTNTQLNNAASMRFSNATTNYVAFKAPAVIGSNVTWTLPATDGSSGNVLSTNGSGVLSWVSTSPSAPTSVEYLIIAGGGGGGYGRAGGGGAGGLLASSTSVTAGTPYTVTVGGPGSGGTNSTGTAGSGSASVFNSISATGGGGGGNEPVGVNSGRQGASGGSGGGGATDGQTATSTGIGGAGISGQGFGGGTSAGLPYAPGGGGGGASAVGATATTTAGGAGGDGSNAYSTWASATTTGVLGYYAGGGGGGAYQPGTGGAGGAGGGGGSTTGSAGTAGTINTGSGGGSGSETTTPAFFNGGSGGSGIVIIRYPDTFNPATTVGATSAVSGGYRYYTFTGSGTIQF